MAAKVNNQPLRSQNLRISHNLSLTPSTTSLSSNGSNFVTELDSTATLGKNSHSLSVASVEVEKESKLDDQIINSVSNLSAGPITNISSTPSNATTLSAIDQTRISSNKNDIEQVTMESTKKVKDIASADATMNPDENYYSDSDSDDDEKEFEVIIYDPSLFKPLPTQIAGHGSEGDGEKGFLKRPDGRLLKPVQAPPRGRRELDFYKRINASKDPTDLRLKKCIPEFFGVEKVGFINGITITEEFLILRDITEGYSRPSIMDIKIGSRTWGPDASAKKQAQENAKYAGTKHPFGFR